MEADEIASSVKALLMPDIIDTIFSAMSSPEEALSVASTCTEWHAAANSSMLWGSRVCPKLAAAAFLITDLSDREANRLEQGVAQDREQDDADTAGEEAALEGRVCQNERTFG